ncbi:MAG: hypothetical protein ABRQ24_10075 [Syntrophomonadaceae bacterium]
MLNNSDNLSKSFEMMEKAMENAWEMWKKGLASFTAVQDQFENMARQQLDQNRAARDELFRMEDDVQKQIRSNQEQLQKMVEGAVTKALEQADKSNQDLVAALTAQVGALMGQVKQNQDQIQHMIKETVLSSYLKREKDQYNAISTLTNQVEELSKKMISMSGQIQKIGRKTDND